MSGVNSKRDTVVIASAAGVVTFENFRAIVGAVYITPVGSVSAANAALNKVVEGVSFEVIAAEAVNTSTGLKLYDNNEDNKLVLISPAGSLQVVFSSATNGDEFVVTIEYID